MLGGEKRGGVIKFALRMLALIFLAPSLSGCAIVYLIGVAMMPEPRILSIDIAWSEDDAICRAAFEGEPDDLEFVGVEAIHYARANVFDFDNDGARDLVYIRDDAIFTAPETRAMREAFEGSRKSESTLVTLGFRVLRRAALDGAAEIAIQRVEAVTYLRATMPDPRRPELTNPAPDRQQANDGEPDFIGAREIDFYRVEPGGATRKVCTFRVVRGLPR